MDTEKKKLKPEKCESSVEIGKRVIEEDDRKEQERERQYDSTAQRLMSRLNTITVDVPFENERGTFTIKCRIPTRRESQEAMKITREFTRLNTAAAEKKNLKKTQKLMTELEDLFSRLYKLVAYPDGICRDPELNMTYWEAGNFSSDLPLTLITFAQQNSRQAILNAKFFRREQEGPSATPTQLRPQLNRKATRKTTKKRS